MPQPVLLNDLYMTIYKQKIKQNSIVCKIIPDHVQWSLILEIQWWSNIILGNLLNYVNE